MLELESFEKLLRDTQSRLEKGEDRSVLKNEILGRQGSLNKMLKEIPNVHVAARGKIGKAANETKLALHELLSDIKEKSAPTIDLSVPITLAFHGHEHPIQHLIAMLYTIFEKQGFDPFITPEIESEQNNFDSLRVPPDHPARDMQDTFWTTDSHVLRTHTTAFQRNALHSLKAPFAVMQGGKIYRSEAEDATHLSEFHQFDGFAVQEGLSFSHLKGTLITMVTELFGKDTPLRFRPSFFPFVEPGAEIDMQCPHCTGKGCRSCGYKGWLELLGCGMTHPEILKSAGLDSNKYQGIAFGMGVERLAMLKYAIDDIREFTKNDPRFLEQLT